MKFGSLMLAGMSLAAVAMPASAQVSAASYDFDLPPQSLADALRTVAARAGLELYAPADAIIGLTSPRLDGRLTAADAIDRLLRGTNLRARFENGAVVIRAEAEASPVETPSSSASPDIVVTGSRIAGAPPTVPVTTIDAADISASGYADLGEIARSLPQSFGGGQNPGIGNSQGAANENGNVNGASTFNLRGIGPNATLTLLNGNRLTYSGTSAAIDVSTIPIALVERVEIVADGASAIYGADAVAGVVNIILRRDFSGVAASGRLGASTDGGNVQQHYDLVGGTNWSTGGIVAAYDYFQNSAIRAGDRSYASASNPETSIYPELRRHSALISGYQQLSSSISLRADIIFKSGRMDSATGFLLAAPLRNQGLTVRRDFSTLAIAPSLDIELGYRWRATIAASYGRDDTDGLTRLFVGGAVARTIEGTFDNASRSLEASAQGPLITIPGGDIRLALGGGARRYDFVTNIPGTNIDRRRSNYFAYGEIVVPLISPDQLSPIAHRIVATGALRVEDYSDGERILTPKLGLAFAPVEGFTVAASWGRSFKLPTLFQQYSPYSALLLPVTGYGAAFPANATYVQLVGANADVGPERSENWLVSAELEPISNLDIGVAYFHIDYRDRVAPPLTTAAGTLTNPVFADLVTARPSAADLAMATEGAFGGLQNVTGSPFDPSTIVAILDARDRNVARQIYQGVDLSFRYRIALADRQSLLLTGGATLLDSKQELIAGLGRTDLAGTIFHPPGFRARTGLTYDRPGFSLSAFVNHSEGIDDNRRAVTVPLRALTTVDLTARVALGQHFELAASALNLFNAKPQAIFTNSPFDTPFDTTNASASGRFVAVTVTTRW